MPKKIIIVRHGQTAENKKKILQGHMDTPLDSEGELQAKKASLILKDEKIDIFFSSDLIRAVKTATAAMEHHKGKKMHTTRLLREKYFGTLQGMTFEQVGKYLSKFGEQGNFSFQGREKEFGVETEDEVLDRIKEFRKILDQHKEKTVAVFSHGGFIRRMLVFFGIPHEEVKNMYIPNATPLVLIKKESTYILQK